MQEELAESLEVTVSVWLRAIGMIQKQGNWGPNFLVCLMNWNRETLKGDFSLANSWFKNNREKVFLHRIVTGDEKWIFYSKKKKYYAKPGQSLPSTSTSTSRSNIHGSKIMLCIWWDQEGLVYYELLKPGDSITSDQYRLQLIRLSCALREKRNTSKDMIKFFFMTTLSLMSLKS